MGVYGVDRRVAKPVLIRIEAYADHRMLLERRLPITRRWPRIERNDEGEVTLVPRDRQILGEDGGTR